MHFVCEAHFYLHATGGQKINKLEKHTMHYCGCMCLCIAHAEDHSHVKSRVTHNAHDWEEEKKCPIITNEVLKIWGSKPGISLIHTLSKELVRSEYSILHRCIVIYFENFLVEIHVQFLVKSVRALNLFIFFIQPINSPKLGCGKAKMNETPVPPPLPSSQLAILTQSQHHRTQFNGHDTNRLECEVWWMSQ